MSEMEFQTALQELVTALDEAAPAINGLITMHHLRYSGDFDAPSSVYQRLAQAQVVARSLLDPTPSPSPSSSDE